MDLHLSPRKPIFQSLPLGASIIQTVLILSKCSLDSMMAFLYFLS